MQLSVREFMLLGLRLFFGGYYGTGIIRRQGLSGACLIYVSKIGEILGFIISVRIFGCLRSAEKLFCCWSYYFENSCFTQEFLKRIY